MTPMSRKPPALWALLLLLLAAPITAQRGATEEASTHPWYYLHNGKFAVRLWMWDPNRDRWLEGRVSWSTQESLLFYVFNRRNPEVMLKILDGRQHNNHSWGDFAAMSDLRIQMNVVNMRTREYWRVQSGRSHDMGGAPTDRRRIVCASPHYRDSEVDGFQCVWGAGLSSREAWRDNGRIPNSFWTERIVGYLE